MACQAARKTMRRFQLIEDWRLVAKRAYSFRFQLAASFFSACEIFVQFTPPEWITWVGPGRFAILAGLCSLAAGVSRLFKQPRMRR